MNPSTPFSREGQPIIVAFEGVPHVLMLGDRIELNSRQQPSLSFRQQVIMNAKLRQAENENVPLVIVLWPSKSPIIHADPNSKLEVQKR